MKTRHAIFVLSAVLLIGFSTTGEAKRFGGGKSSGINATPSKKAHDNEDESSESKGGPAVSIRLSRPGGSGASTESTAMPVGAAGFGVAADSADAKALSPEEAMEIRKKQAQDELRARKEMEERKAALAEMKKREKQEAERLALINNEKEADAQRKARESLCVIKPVMTDADISLCREVWR